jgi:hypothetical protein
VYPSNAEISIHFLIEGLITGGFSIAMCYFTIHTKAGVFQRYLQKSLFSIISRCFSKSCAGVHFSPFHR